MPGFTGLCDVPLSLRVEEMVSTFTAGPEAINPFDTLN